MKKEIFYIDVKNRKMKMILLKPKNNKKLLPGILWIHGGGYALGSASMVHFSKGKSLAKKFGTVVISPNYCTSLKKPYPAAFNDCCKALEYMYNNADKLGIDKNKIIVGGESAGGGLAVSVCLYARDKKIPIIFQIPLYPMLDCYDTKSSENNHGHIWNTKRNHAAWKLYLGNLYNTNSIPKYASPSRETDYSNLPPCYTYVTNGEPFYLETLTYIKNLKKANVDANVDVFNGKTHVFDMILFWTKNAKEAKKKLFEAVKKFF